MIDEDKYPDILYKYLKYKDGLSMIQNKELWFTRAKKLNDPYDCYLTHKPSAEYKKFNVEIDLNPIFGNIGICSLSADLDNIAMWSYYTCHYGLCIGIDMKIVRKKLLRQPQTNQGYKYVFIKKVVYQENVPKINLHDIIPANYESTTEDYSDKAQNAINGFFAAKSKVWENENEYRLILREGTFQNTNEPAKVRIESLIKNVFIGCKNDSDPSPIIKLAQKNKFNVYKMKIKTDQYGLNYDVLYEVEDR